MSKEPENYFGTRIRDMREIHGLSQGELASLSGTSQQTVDRIERGETKHSRAVPKILKVLNERTEGVQTRRDHAMPRNERLISIVPMRGNTYPVFLVQGGDNAIVFAFFSSIPTALVDDPGTYAITLQTTQFEPIFSKGDYLFVDVEIDPLPGNYVLAAPKKGADVAVKDSHGRGIIIGELRAIEANEYSIKEIGTARTRGFSRDEWLVNPIISRWSSSQPLAGGKL